MTEVERRRGETGAELPPRAATDTAGACLDNPETARATRSFPEEPVRNESYECHGVTYGQRDRGRGRNRTGEANPQFDTAEPIGHRMRVARLEVEYPGPGSLTATTGVRPRRQPGLDNRLPRRTPDLARAPGI